MSTQTRATYRTMAEGTAEDYALIIRAEANNAGPVTRVLKLVEALADGQQAYPVSRLEHSLQSATRDEAS
jgi:predicted HD phosphohydrolase